MMLAIDVVLAGLDPITLTVIGIGLSVLAGELLKNTIENTIRDDAPTPVATRGTFVPYIRGLARVGPVVALAGGRRSTQQNVCGGKGDLFAQKETVFFEHGLHVLALGPIHALHGIYENGTKIFSGPITSASHTSGSSLSAGDAGSFRIYWGEQNQGIDSLLTAELGIASRFPLFCFIVWDDKRLGTSPRWGSLSYVIEGRVQETGLIDTSAHMAGTEIDEGAPNTIVEAFDGAEGASSFQISGYHLNRYEIGETFVVAGNTASGTYTVFAANYNNFSNRTAILPTGGLSGSDDNGTTQAREFQNDDGVNLAHVIWEMLFAQSPYGLALDQSEWDIPSLEALGTLSVTENLKGNVVGEAGETVEALLATILQDLGVLLPVNFETGLLEFVSIRTPTGMLPDISSRLLANPLPEIEQFHDEKPTDSIVFAFRDRALNLRKNTIFIDDTGQAQQFQHKKYKEIEISSTITFETASLIGNRRELEEFTGKSKITIHALRGARTLKPGDAITIDGFDEIMRVWTTSIDPLSSEVTLTVSPDFYGQDLDSFLNSPPPVTSEIQPPAPDLAVSLLEIPTGLLPLSTEQALSVLRIRAHDAIASADIHLSADDTTFVFNLTEIRLQTGGTLDAELPATGLSHTDGFTFTVLGPDIAQVLDLTADAANWRVGRQLLVIGDEIMYLRSITAEGGGVFSVNDVLRARYCTRKATHAASTPVFIVTNDGATPVTDPLLQPNQTIFVKSQPRAGSPVALADITSTSKALHGVGRKPGDVENIGVIAPTTNHRDEYSTSDDITVSWRVCLPITDLRGAGALPAGDPLIDSPVAATYRLEWLTTGDVVQRTDTVTGTTEFTITNAELQTAFSGEPASFVARVTNNAMGLDSRNTETTITLV